MIPPTNGPNHNSCDSSKLKIETNAKKIQKIFPRLVTVFKQSIVLNDGQLWPAASCDGGQLWPAASRLTPFLFIAA